MIQSNKTNSNILILSDTHFQCWYILEYIQYSSIVSKCFFNNLLIQIRILIMSILIMLCEKTFIIRKTYTTTPIQLLAAFGMVFLFPTRPFILFLWIHVSCLSQSRQSSLCWDHVLLENQRLQGLKQAGDVETRRGWDAGASQRQLWLQRGHWPQSRAGQVWALAFCKLICGLEQGNLSFHKMKTADPLTQCLRKCQWVQLSREKFGNMYRQ